MAEALTARGCRVDFILGASTQEKLFGMLEARRISTTLSVTTDDGTSGVMGRVTDVLPDVIKKSGAAVVYSCGPMQMLKAVSEVATLHGIVSQTSVEESMACGIGVCMTCVMPIIGEEKSSRPSLVDISTLVLLGTLFISAHQFLQLQVVLLLAKNWISLLISQLLEQL